MLVLGVESSCDETAAAVLADGRRILSNVVASQDALHAPYGGVVPELASRRHLEVIVPVVETALADAGVGLSDLDGIAVTQGPGLVGSLLVGCSLAKSLAYVHDKPLVGVNHLEGHIYAAFLTDDPPVHPFLALVVSGGHTALYHARAPLAAEAAEHGITLHVPPPRLCTDNAAMITAAGTARLEAGERAPLGMNALPNMELAPAPTAGHPPIAPASRAPLQ